LIVEFWRIIAIEKVELGKLKKKQITSIFYYDGLALGTVW
jgi:hypothetical protein